MVSRSKVYSGERCYIGLDLASKQDIAAAVYLFPLPSERFAVYGRYYLPEAALAGPNGDRYRQYAAEGRLTLTDGALIDHDRIAEDLKSALERFAVVNIAFDPWNATALVTRLIGEGAPMIEFRKTVQNVSEPMKTLAGLIDDGRIVHDGDQALAWMLSNVTARPDANENVFPRKERDENKIDGADALIMALAVALQAEGREFEPLVMAI